LNKKGDYENHIIELSRKRRGGKKIWGLGERIQKKRFYKEMDTV